MRASATVGPLVGGIGAASGTLVAAAVLAASIRGHRATPLPFPELAQPLGYQVVALALLAVVLIVAWLLSLDHSPSAFAFSLAATAAVVPVLAGRADLPDEVRAVVSAMGVVSLPAIAWAVVCWRFGSAPRPLTWGLPILGGATWLFVSLAYDPFLDPYCVRTCSETSPPLAGVVPATGLDVAATVPILASVMVTVLWIARADAVPLLLRVVAAPVLGVLAASEILVAIATPTSDALARTTITRLAAVTAAATAAGVLEARDLVRRRAVLRLARELAEPNSWGGREPGRSSRVLFAVPGEDRWVDLEGHEATSCEGMASIDVRYSDGSPFLRLHEPLRGTPDGWFGVLTPQARLGLRNAQLAAALRFRIDQVRASQRRVVAASDRERHRLERDLHDGAQQRLVSVALHLRAARSDADAETTAWLSTAETSVLGALAQLRRISQGVFPATLLIDGLDAALHDLVAKASVPVDLDVRLPRAPHAEAGMAAYAVVTASLDLYPPSGIGRLAVRIRAGEDSLHLTVDAPGINFADADLVPIADRVEAAGGALNITDQALTVVIPCGS